MDSVRYSGAGVFGPAILAPPSASARHGPRAYDDDSLPPLKHGSCLHGPSGSHAFIVRGDLGS